REPRSSPGAPPPVWRASCPPIGPAGRRRYSGGVSIGGECLKIYFQDFRLTGEDCSEWRLAFALRTCAKSIAPLPHWLQVVVLLGAPMRKTGSRPRPKFQPSTAFRSKSFPERSSDFWARTAPANLPRSES